MKNLYAFIAFSSLALGLIAQTPEYSNGPLSGTSGNSIPWSYSASGCRAQLLYPVGAFGTPPSGQVITSIYYSAYPGATPPSVVQYDILEVALKQENLTTLSSGSWVTGTTNVINSTEYYIYPVQGQWHEIPLETPFVYNPALPLIVDVKSLTNSFVNWYCFTKPTTSTGAWRAYSTTGYSATAPTANGAHELFFGFDLEPNGIYDFPYCEDFEAHDGYWTTGGNNNSWEYGEPVNTIISGANSGDSAWVSNLDGNYNNDEVSYLRSPRVNLEPLVSPTIRFYTIRDLQSGTDGVTMQASSDSGSTWTTLGSSSSPSPWFNSGTISGLGSSTGNSNGWTGTTSTWTPMQHSLSTYTGDTAFFVRFLLASNSSTVAEGFGFDDVVIGESDDVAITALIYDDSVCGSTATTVRAEICNRSVTEQSGITIDFDTNGTGTTVTYGGTLSICSCDTVDLLTMNTANGGTWNLSAELNQSGDVNNDNDTISGTMVHYAIPSAAVSGGGSACEGQAIQVTFTLTGTSPWNLQYHNGTTVINNYNLTTNPHTILVNYNGTFTTASLSDGSGCPADTGNFTGSATTVFTPAPEIDLGPDTIVCEGYTLDAGAGGSTYTWSNGASTQTIVPSADGMYSVTVTDANNCSANESVYLEILSVPNVNLPDTVLCQGGTFVFNAGGGGASYLWHDGSTGQVFQTSSAVTVSVTVTSFDGCEASDVGTITAVVPNPTPVLTGTSSLAPVTLNAGSGYLAYLWNTNATTQTILVSIPGTYTCTVTDLNGCKGSDDIKTKIWATGIAELAEQEGVAVHPNPAKEFTTVTTAAGSQIQTVELLDVNGRLMAIDVELVKSTEARLNTQNVAAGNYLIRVKTDEKTLDTPLIITK